MANEVCLNCGSSRLNPIWHLDSFPILWGAVPLEKKDSVQRYPLTICACEDCSLVQQTELLPKDVIEDIYREEYYNCPSPAANQMGSDVIDDFCDFFAKSMTENGRRPSKGKLLEIGCFDGFLLQKLEKEWDVYGCDPSTATEKVAIPHFGEERIKNTFFDGDTYPPGEFDVVIFRNVLEHLYDLHDFMGSVEKCLKPNGTIFITVPNVDGILETGSFASFFHQHITYYSTRTLSDLVGRHGFRVTDVEDEGFLTVRAVREVDTSGDDSYASNDQIEAKIEHFHSQSLALKSHLTSIFDSQDAGSVAIFGASVMATVILDVIGDGGRNKVTGIFDNDSEKHGKVLVGGDVVIESPDRIPERGFDRILISTFIYHDEIRKQLIDMGVDANRIVSVLPSG